MISLAIAAALLVQGTPQKFDLVCDGKSSSGTLTGNMTERPWSTRISVDLDTRQFCFQPQGCSNVQTIQEITPEYLVLGGDDTDIEPQRVNRRTGRLTTDMVIMPAGFRMTQDAMCKVEPFTGFPAKLF